MIALIVVGSADLLDQAVNSQAFAAAVRSGRWFCPAVVGEDFCDWYLTKGITHEKNPNRDGGSADGRERVGATPAVGGAGGEHAGQCKSRGAIQYDERKGD